MEHKYYCEYCEKYFDTTWAVFQRHQDECREVYTVDALRERKRHDNERGYK